VEKRLMKKSQTDEDEDYMLRMGLLPSIKKKNWTTFKDWNPEHNF